MDTRIKNLLQKGFFKNINIDEKGYGSFMGNVEGNKSNVNLHIESARAFKREADFLMKEQKDLYKSEAVCLYIKAMFFYIKGYVYEEGKISKINSISYYKGLYKYLLDILKIVDATRIKEYLNLCLFAIKFHYLDLEASLTTETETSKSDKYFSRELNSLYSKFKLINVFYKIDQLEQLFFNVYNSDNVLEQN